MAQSLKDIEDVALKLSDEDRARLAMRMLTSLEEQADAPQMLEELWIKESERRFEEIRSGTVQGVPARDVFSQARDKLPS